MKYPKFRELKEAFISLVTPAYTTRFPQEEHVPFENFRGKPVVDDDNCIGCLTCANICPAKAITVSDDPVKKTRAITRNYGRCLFCGQCEANCLTGKGVKLSNKIYDLSTTNRNDLIESQEKILLTCKNCGAVITTPQHINFLYHKIGPNAYSSFISLSQLNESLGLATREDVEVEVIDNLKRKDMFNILCPNCMRKVQVKNLL